MTFSAHIVQVVSILLKYLKKKRGGGRKLTTEKRPSQDLYEMGAGYSHIVTVLDLLPKILRL